MLGRETENKPVSKLIRPGWGSELKQQQVAVVNNEQGESMCVGGE